MAAVPQAFTVIDAINQIGITDRTLFNGATKAQRIATELFDDDFTSCLDKTFSEIDEDLKSWSALTVNNGQIRLTPMQKKNLKAFIQWSKNKLRQGQDPTAEAFTIDQASVLIAQYKTHAAFISKASTLADSAKPDCFTDKMQWKDWKPTFVNYLRHIPGRYGVPLLYIIRDYTTTIEGDDILTSYIRNAPHEGEAFNTDASKVHTYLVNFIKGNTVAESRLASHGFNNNGLQDMKVLCEQYEGVGINAMELDAAEKDINSLNYNGERRPITWEQFELRIMNAFSTINKHENRVVYSDMQKLRILNRKINADFLHGTKTVINTELARVPMTMTFAHALASYRNAVLEKHPVEINQRNHRPHYRRINQTSRGGRGRGGRYHNGNGRGGRGQHGRGGYRNNKRGHPEARWIQGNDGRQIEVHHSYSFRPNIWNNIPREEQRKIQSD